MTPDEAKKLIAEILEKIKNMGVDHYEVSDTRKGNKKYLNLSISIKIRD